ncbi:hypothetical protein MSP7336_00455 [Mycobacterium shimoidei]|uniref:DUF1214 domain-containing protein n=1 Tax=Mycobacterium shimoidei TaxID=29313 RepID=A0A375YU36_MYCSH|nr:DUF1214 domain-containing protein [Mycobacterium shimoidei]SRX92230.1 hypothetical protein MSP7336_00455 [Mycobacterium shimoidei]
MATGSQRVVRLAGTAASMATGALALFTLSPHAVAEPNPLQPVIDQLIQAQQQVEADTSGFPFVRPTDVGPMLHEYSQNLASTLLASQLPPLTFSQFDSLGIPWAPYPWNAPATNMQQFLTLANPDAQYGVLPVDPDHTYTITVYPGPGTQDLTFAVNAGDGVTVDYTPLRGFNLANATPNPDGSYSIVLSATVQQGNWVDIGGGDRVIIRDTVGDWGQIHDSLTIQEEGVTQSNMLPLLSENQISSLLATVAGNEVRENLSPTYFGQMDVPQSLPDNTFSPIQPTVPFMPGPLLPGNNQISSLGNFSLEPGQALILKVPDVDAAYSSAMLANTFGQTAAPVTATGNLNDTQVFHAADGFTYYVISSQDPGVANWLDTGGVDHGEVWLRWQGLSGEIATTPVQAEVVDIADVREELPADTPLITPAERAADLQERLFEWDYAHHQNNGLAWLAGNLEYNQIKAAMGAEQFNEIFGGQTTVFGVPQDVPSVVDRLTSPELIPNIVTIVNAMLADPENTLTAIINNVPLAIKDIELPVIFSVLSLQEAVQGGLGAPSFATVFENMLTDPVTSITAGILNARDDLAVAVMNASDSTSFDDAVPLWASLEQINQGILQTLTSALDLLP